jgi:sugar transferase (PEP-CTERM/EpsH1 system associated)
VKTLLLVHRVPFPPNRGDRIRSWQLVKWLAARGQVDLATLADEPVADATHVELNAVCNRVAIEPVGGISRWSNAAVSLCLGHTATEGLFASKPLRRTLAAWTRAEQYDVVVVVCSGMMPYVEIPSLQGVPVIVDLVDVDSEKWRDYANASSGVRRQLFSLECRRNRRLEQRVSRRASAMMVVSSEEARLLQAFAPQAPVQAVGNGVDLDYYSPNAGFDRQAADDSANSAGEFRRGNEIVFVGALDYRANVDGVLWFCEHVWPELRRRLPTVHLTLVGRRPATAITALARTPGISVAADVPDVRPYVARASAVIAPLRIARGVQNKVLEAAAMARPVVASPQALTGLELVPGEHVLCAAEPREWIASLAELIASPERQEQIGETARRFVERRYRWDAQFAPIADLLTTAIECERTNALRGELAAHRSTVA